MSQETPISAAKWITVYILGFVAVLASLTFGIWLYVKPPVKIVSFEAEHKSQAWNFSSEAKDLNLVYFGFSKCPDVCPMSLSYSAGAFQKLSDQQRKNAQLIFFSVDSENDTSEQTAVYASQFNPNFIGVKSDPINTQKVAAEFGASYSVEKKPGTYLGYSISHTDKIFFVQKNGKVIDEVANPQSSEEILLKLKEYL